MKIIIPSKVQPVPTESALFTGKVTRQPAVSDDMSKSFNLSIVNFPAGVRNKFHTHTTDQVLIVTAGAGIVADDHGQHRVIVGDIIHIPAGEKHWHGAGRDAAFSHITLTGVGSQTQQIEP